MHGKVKFLNRLDVYPSIRKMNGKKGLERFNEKLKKAFWIISEPFLCLVWILKWALFKAPSSSFYCTQSGINLDIKSIQAKVYSLKTDEKTWGFTFFNWNQKRFSHKILFNNERQNINSQQCQLDRTCRN